uniref:diacylglycerol O-acyltransferase n=2 Tax=Clastoptera arizonana TaxID=38151 RepID=A0A1B6DYG0_9HEMI
MSEIENNHIRRRTKSVTRAEDIKKIAARLRRSQPDRPCHKPRDSLFSWSSDFNDYSGFFNWGFLLLFMGGVRLLLENLLKYGILVDPEQWLVVLTGRQEGGPEHPSIILICYTIVPVVICLLIEKALAKEAMPARTGLIAHVLNLTVLVLIPIVIIHIYSSGFSLVGATSVCFLYCILFLKLWSYVQVNLWCRKEISIISSKIHLRRQSLSTSKISSMVKHEEIQEEEELHLVQYPNNLSLKDLYYFILAPTLCYELNFPRTERVRKRFLLKRLFEVLILVQVMMSLFQQWIIPSVKNSLIPFSGIFIGFLELKL